MVIFHSKLLVYQRESCNLWAFAYIPSQCQWLGAVGNSSANLTSDLPVDVGPADTAWSSFLLVNCTTFVLKLLNVAFFRVNLHLAEQKKQFLLIKSWICVQTPMFKLQICLNMSHFLVGQIHHFGWWKFTFPVLCPLWAIEDTVAHLRFPPVSSGHDNDFIVLAVANLTGQTWAAKVFCFLVYSHS